MAYKITNFILKLLKLDKLVMKEVYSEKNSNMTAQLNAMKQSQKDAYKAPTTPVATKSQADKVTAKTDSNALTKHDIAQLSNYYSTMISGDSNSLSSCSSSSSSCSSSSSSCSSSSSSCSSSGSSGD